MAKYIVTRMNNLSPMLHAKCAIHLKPWLLQLWKLDLFLICYLQFNFRLTIPIKEFCEPTYRWECYWQKLLGAVIICIIITIHEWVANELKCNNSSQICIVLKQVWNLKPNSFIRYSHTRKFDFAVPPKTNQLHKFIGLLKLSDNKLFSGWIWQDISSSNRNWQAMHKHFRTCYGSSVNSLCPKHPPTNSPNWSPYFLKELVEKIW